MQIFFFLTIRSTNRLFFLDFWNSNYETTEPELQPGPEPQPQPEPEAQPEPELQPEPDPQPEPEPEL